MSTVLELTRASKESWQCRRQVQRRLTGIRRSMRAHLFWEGLAWTVAAVVGLAALSLLIDRWLRPELSSRLVLLALAAAAVAAVAWRLLITPMGLKLADLDLAELLDRRLPGTGQRIANVLQLPELLERGKIDGSPAMIEAAVNEDAAELEKIDLRATLNVNRRRIVVALLVATAAAAILFYVLFPTVATVWTKRWLGGSNLRWPQHTYLSMLGLNDEGKLLVPRNESAIIEVETQPEFEQEGDGWRVAGRGKEVLIASAAKPQSEVPQRVSIEYRLASGTRKQGTLTHTEGSKFRYELPPLAEPATITLEGGDDWTAPIEIEPIDRPTVKDVTITAKTPGRQEPEVIHAGQPDAQLLFLPTTKLEIALTSDQPLQSARIVTPGDSVPQLETIDPSHYRAEMTMKETVTWEFQLVGQRGALESKPFLLTIGLQTDRPPRVTIRVTGVGRRVTPTARIPLVIRALDDFGVAQMAADVELTQIVDAKSQTSMHEVFTEKFGSENTALPLDIEKQPLVKLAELNAVPGNIIRVRGRAADACVLGVQEGVSRWVPLQVVTPEELFYEILTRQREQRGRFSKALEMAKGQLESIQQLTSADEGASLSRVHQVVVRQIWQIAGQLDGTLQEMIYNDLGSEQARDLLANSIIVPMRKLHDETFTDVAEKMQTLLTHREIRDADRQALADAQQTAVTEMQRILAQMSQWESFVDVINQLRQIIKTQNEVLESTEKTEKDRIKGLFD
jgi:hypothetical protein